MKPLFTISKDKVPRDDAFGILLIIGAICILSLGTAWASLMLAAVVNVATGRKVSAVAFGIMALGILAGAILMIATTNHIAGGG